MKLFTALSAAEADAAERGALRGDFVWVDNPRAEQAPEGAVWVTIEVQDKRLPRFETRPDLPADAREFLLPSRLTNLHRPQRVKLQA